MPPSQTVDARARDAAFAAFALHAAHDAGAAILPHFRAPLDVEDKGGARGYDPVTEADRAAEAVIREAITSRYPDHGIIAEDTGPVTGQPPLPWAVDRIAGPPSSTVGHLHGGRLSPP